MADKENLPPNTIEKLRKQPLQYQREVTQEKAEQFTSDIKKFMEELQAGMKELASKHSKTEAYVKLIVMCKTHYKKKRKVNLYNAKIAQKSKELNDGRPPGHKASLAEIRAAVREDEDMEGLSSDKEEALREELEESRGLKEKGARISNRAATLDAGHIFQRMDEEMDALHERTGVVSLAFMAQSHINDSTPPGFIVSGGAAKFCLEVLRMSPDIITHQLELYACMRSTKKANPESLGNLQKSCKKLILDGLISITNDTNAEMSYKQHDSRIKVKYRVFLQGWPAGVPFKPPGRISTMDEIRALRDTLVSGDCIWSTLTRREVEEAASEVQQAPKKPCKKRLDAGKKRGANKRKTAQRPENNEGEDESDDKVEEPPRKKAKRANKAAAMIPPAVFKSTEFIENSDKD
ncbi:hypothetical protein H1R20_g14939, partial [Candolleomyces eurysporus]